MVEVPEPFRTQVLEYAKDTIDKEDIVKIEDEPHVTIKYGIETNRVEEVAKAIGKFIPIRVMFGATKMFMASSANPTDVLKIDVFGMSLKKLRKRIEDNIDTNDVWRTYYPHVTLAYLKEYAAMQYIGSNPLIEGKFVTDKVVFSPAYGDKKIITCDGTILNYE